MGKKWSELDNLEKRRIIDSIERRKMKISDARIKMSTVFLVICCILIPFLLLYLFFILFGFDFSKLFNDIIFIFAILILTFIFFMFAKNKNDIYDEVDENVFVKDGDIKSNSKEVIDDIKTSLINDENIELFYKNNKKCYRSYILYKYLRFLWIPCAILVLNNNFDINTVEGYRDARIVWSILLISIILSMIFGYLCRKKYYDMEGYYLDNIFDLDFYYIEQNTFFKNFLSGVRNYVIFKIRS